MPVVLAEPHGTSWYTGDTSGGQRHGFGIMCYPNAERYIGEWSRGQRHGIGLYAYEDGTVYDGDWQHDDASGHGMCFYSTGNVYDGQWEGGHLNGRGTMYYADGDVYNGEWRDGRLHGEGEYTDSAGVTHRGQWLEDEAVSSEPGAVVVAKHSEPSTPRTMARAAERLRRSREELELRRGQLSELLQRVAAGCASGAASRELLAAVRPWPSGTLDPPPQPLPPPPPPPPAPAPAVGGGLKGAPLPPPTITANGVPVSPTATRSPGNGRAASPRWSPVSRGRAAEGPASSPTGPLPRDFLAAVPMLSTRSSSQPNKEIAESPPTSPCAGRHRSDSDGSPATGQAADSSSLDSSSSSGWGSPRAATGPDEDSMQVPRRIFDRLRTAHNFTITRSQLAADIAADPEVQNLGLASLQHRHAWHRVVRQGAEENPEATVEWAELERDMLAALESRRQRFQLRKLDDGSVGVNFQGRRVCYVLPGSPADRAGLRRGMTLLTIANRPVMDCTDDVEAAIRGAGRVFEVTARPENAARPERRTQRVSKAPATASLPAPVFWSSSTCAPLGGSFVGVPADLPAASGGLGVSNASLFGAHSASKTAAQFLAALWTRRLGGAAAACAAKALAGDTEDQLIKQRDAALIRERRQEARKDEVGGARDSRSHDSSDTMRADSDHAPRQVAELTSQPSSLSQGAAPLTAPAVPAKAFPAVRWEGRGHPRRSPIAERVASAPSQVPSPAPAPALAASPALLRCAWSRSPLHWKAVLAKCGPAKEPFNSARFAQHIGMMLFPFPFLPCSPLAPSLADWERRVVVAGARPRLWEDPTPANFLLCACCILPLLVISVLWAARGEHGEDPSVSHSDVFVPLVLYALFAIISAVHHAFPREPHALEKLDDKCFNDLARIAYEQIPVAVQRSTDDLVVRWNTNHRVGPVRFQVNKNMRRRWYLAAMFLGLLVGFSVPVYRRIKYKTWWGTTQGSRVMSTFSAVSTWFSAAGFFELIFRLHFQQRQLVHQLQMMTRVAVLGPPPPLAQQPSQRVEFDLLDVSPDALDSTFASGSGGEPHSFIGWFFVRSFSFYGSPALNHNARCAVIGTASTVAALTCVLVCGMFVADLVRHGHPRDTTRHYVVGTIMLLFATPFLVRHLHMWQNVRGECKRHYRLIASAAVFKHAEAMRLLSEGRDDIAAAESQHHAFLLTSVSAMLADQDYRPRILGVDIGPQVTLSYVCIYLLAFVVLIFRWYHHTRS
eukprot:TRINITY_DN25849_c3_g1_i1.p1 TRINITY_DN25849_c3_g1~~TRINITY_DN25849_c3_g1_i1.p1  ORF type:complete len:1267 (+),score=286.32 TRINITY_DN25849_c3_g1_i1:89-3802(+)